MKQKLIRDIPDDVMSAIEQKAQAASQNSEEWIRNLLIRVAGEPIIRERYAYRFFGPGEARGMVRRLSNHVNGVGSGFDRCTEAQAQAIRQVQDLMRRNDPGDQLKAYDVLKSAFEEVFEVPV